MWASFIQLATVLEQHSQLSCFGYFQFKFQKFELLCEVFWTQRESKRNVDRRSSAPHLPHFFTVRFFHGILLSTDSTIRY